MAQRQSPGTPVNRSSQHQCTKLLGFVMSQSIARGLLRHYTTLLSDDGLRRASREHGRGWVP